MVKNAKFYRTFVVANKQWFESVNGTEKGIISNFYISKCVNKVQEIFILGFDTRYISEE